MHFSTSCRPTRNLTQGNFNRTYVNNMYGERQVQFTGVKIWNSLPLELKQLGAPFGQIQQFFLSMLSLLALYPNMSRTPVKIVTLSPIDILCQVTFLAWCRVYQLFILFVNREKNVYTIFYYIFCLNICVETSNLVMPFNCNVLFLHLNHELTKNCMIFTESACVVFSDIFFFHWTRY